MTQKSSLLNRLLRRAIGAASIFPNRHDRQLRSAFVEQLEQRTLLSTITWGSAGGGDFNTASNWIGDHVPGASDDAVINEAGNVTITYTSGTTSVHSINSTDTLAISGGALTLTSGSSVISGGLTVSGGATLTAIGGSTSLSVSGTANINGANITAAAGASIALPTLTTYLAPTTSLTVVTLQATGTGSILDLSHITSLTGGSVFDGGVNIEALAGGDLKLTALPSITAQTFLKSDGSGSVLDLSSLTSFTTTNNAFASGLQCTNSGHVLDSLLTTLSGPTLTLDGTSVISTSQITSFTGGQINLSGGTPNFSSLTDFNASGATISSGGTLVLSVLTSYQTPTATETVVTLEATGSGSILDMSNVSSLSGPEVFDCGTNIEALAGGDIKLTAVPSITAQVYLESDGSGSVLDISNVTALNTTSDAYTSGLQCTNSGHVLDGRLTTLTGPAQSLQSGSTLVLDGTSVISTSQITSFTGGQINLSGGTPNFSGLTDFNASGATVSGGGTLVLSALTSYQTPTTSEVVATLEATGSGSILDMSHVTSLSGPEVFDCGTNIEALTGGDIKLTAVPSITAQVYLESDGSGSVLDISNVTALNTTSDAYTSGLQCTNSGHMLDGSLTTLTGPAQSLQSGSTLVLDGTSVISTSQITSFTGGQINLSGGTPNFSGLTDFNASGATVSGGGTLVLSALTSYQTPTTSEVVVTLEATGAGSILDLSSVTSLTGPTVFDCGTNIEALAGGTVKLTAVPSITAQVFLESDGSGSVLNLSSLTTLTTTNDAYTSGLQCTTSGHVLDSLLTTLSGPTLTLDGTSVISTSQITSFTGGQINLSGGTPNFSGLTDFNASGATVSGGTLVLSALTSYQTPTATETVVTLEATGSGSVLDLSHVTSLTGPTVFDCGTNVEALAGGDVKLSQLVTVSAQAFFETDGAGSVLDLSNLAYITTTNDAFTSGFQASNGGLILRSSLGANSGFESGNASWNLSAGASVVSDSANAHSGSGVAEITTNGGYLWQALTGLMPNTTYQLTIWTKSSSKTTGTVLVRIDHDGTSNANAAGWIPGSTYSQTAVTFTTGAGTTTANVVLANIGDGTAYFDDLGLAASPIANADFESGTASWNLSTGATVANDSTNAYSGNNVAEITSNGGFLWQAITGLTPNTTYQLTAWTKTASKSSGTVLMRVDHDGQSNTNTANFIPGSYTQTIVTFTTGATTTTANVVLANVGNGTAYFDDLSLVASPIANANFEVDNTSWNLSTGATIANDSSNAYTGNYEAKITTNGGFLWQTLTGLKSSTTYQLTLWAKTSSKTTGTVLLRVDHDGVSNPNATGFIPGSTYSQTSVTFTTGASTTTANVVLANIGDGTAYFDNLSLIATPLANPDFESGSTAWNLSSGATVVNDSTKAYSGSNVAQITTNGGFLWQGLTGLKANTTYQLTLWAKTSSKTTGTVLLRVDHDGISNANAASFIPGSTFTQTSVTFTTGATTTTATVVLANIGDGTAYLDDLNLVATPIGNAGFESGSTSWNPSAGVTIATDPANAHSGAGVAEITTNGGFLWQTLTNLQANTTYELTVWAKTSGTTGSLLARVDHDGTSSANIAGWNPGVAYGQTAVLFTTGASTTSVTIVLANLGNGTAYFDDLMLTALS